MKNKKQIKQTIKTMKQVSFRKKKTKRKQPQHNKEESVCFFACYFVLESEHQPEAARSFFSAKCKNPNFYPILEDRHVSDNLIRTSQGERKLKVSRRQLA